VREKDDTEKDLTPGEMSDGIVAAVKKNGVPVEYVVFPDEGHGFSKKKNQIQGYGAIREFLDTHLKGMPGPATGAP
jgi:dipeptidyl aminopeptidase/acylaminoacyl peptidase